jgi:hypothetical protein
MKLYNTKSKPSGLTNFPFLEVVLHLGCNSNALDFYEI